jgi:hypothetical protein
MFAICLGGKYMMAGNLGSYQVNPFLHNLRKAMLACPLIREKLKESARSYIFYTEFYESIWSLRNRIAAIAKAHAGADLGASRSPPAISPKSMPTWTASRAMNP